MGHTKQETSMPATSVEDLSMNLFEAQFADEQLAAICAAGSLATTAFEEFAGTKPIPQEGFAPRAGTGFTSPDGKVDED